MTGHHLGPKQKLQGGYRVPSLHRRAICCHSHFCLLNVLHCNAHHISYCQVWYHTLSLCYACIQHPGINRIILIRWAIFVPNSVSFAASVAELARGEKIMDSVNQSISLVDALGTKLFASELML